MKAVLLSIKPEYCKLIARGAKTIDVRKTRPKVEIPFKCYIYCTKSGVKGLEKLDFYLRKLINPLPSNLFQGKIIGEFICDDIITAELGSYYIIPAKGRCCMADTLLDYAGSKTIYGWHISNLIIYYKPKDLYKFTSCHNNNDCKNCLQHSPRFHREGRCLNFLKRPPQSWYYVEEEN